MSRRPRDIKDISCRNCGTILSRRENGRLRIHVHSRVLSVGKLGQVEMRCPKCKLLTELPLEVKGTKNTGSVQDGA